ncbi:uncharacterized protein J7T54_004999 [Emericellopsis cladophorae]|uniref:Chromosome segregation ATPase family protein n=1 Tax=Emericellopsis cladophorae TaxID=2686198 RepID=A0A9P9Y296_9HYPO|nr:uncharacterized protein J7T54_004999 [Emericellopsis cladophorae]KAI6781833.1 hypothetical protein J7T54_004999 [Emericellopsis cladophorae]
MAHYERESPQEGQQCLRHSHSASSDQGSRALVPMWDSSDPERAPPPLPLNPQSPSLTSRVGTSSAIQSAHAALNEKARESAALVPHVPKRMNDFSPERTPTGHSSSSHRRTQTLQPGSVRGLSLMLEGATQSPTTSPSKSPEKSLEKSYFPHTRSSTATPTPIRHRDQENDQEGLSERGSPTKEPLSLGPMPGSSLTPIVRPTVRRPPPQSILGENTPPQSSTMLALQTMGSQTSRADSEPPLSNVTNGATAGSKQPQITDNLSAQILSLTNIATSLQKEMSALSRRSRDNATDLLSLKEATNTRDEDIRKSLRDLLGSVNETSHRITSGPQYGGLYLDNKPHNIASPGSRGFHLPRIPSPKSFSDSIDRGSVSTPSLVGGDGSASITLLEKIIRDMGTKEGQDTLISRLAEVSTKLSGMATASKVEELVSEIQAQAENAVITRGPPMGDRGRAFSYEDGESQAGFNPGASHLSSRVDAILHNEGRRSSAPAHGAEILNEDLIKIIRSVKDSVAQGGGLTAEVKALVRELRGEVLGMGREIGKRLEQVGHRGIEESDQPSKDDVSRVIDEGLEQMKDQLNHVLREHRRQSAQSAATSKSLVDYQEIYNAMRAALRDNEAAQSNMPDLSRDDVIEAVRDAWETYKPEIEVQQLGLERDEVLACLQEGLREYAPRDERPSGATRDEVFTAVVEGLQHFTPPQVDTPASMSRDEIIEAVRDCLEEFEFPVAASAIGAPDITKEDMIHAVKEGLNDMDIPRGGALVPAGGNNNEEIMSRLEDLIGYIKLEFKAVSQEAKDNVAANGRDTEQVLDATKDGLESLRVAIESYVDRATGGSMQEEFLQGLAGTMEDFKDDISHLLNQSADGSREQLQTELEGLREIVNSSMVPATPQQQGNNQEILDALSSAANSLRQEILRPRSETAEILDALNDGLNELKAGIDRMSHKPADLTANDEILDALKSGLDSVRSDIETIRENNNDQALAAVATVRDTPSMDQAMIPADMVKQDDIKNLEVLITQLRIKLEAMEPEEKEESVQKADLTRLEDMLRNVQQGVEEISTRETSAVVPKAATVEDDETHDAPRAANGDAATKDDVEAIETILRNTKARLDDLMDGDQAVRKDHLDTVETLILETRETMSAMAVQLDVVSRKEDLTTLEALITQIKTDFEEVKEKSEKVEEDTDKVSKTDVEAVETVVLEIKNILDVFQGVDFNNMPQKEDLAGIETAVREAQEKIESFKESSTALVEAKDVELNSVGDRVTEVKTFLETFQETLTSKLEDGNTGVEALGKLLETMGEKIDKNENIGTDLKDMFDTMKTEFEDSKAVVAGARLESDEKLQVTTEGLQAKIDEKITELVTKYDEFMTGFDEKMAVGEKRSLETEEAVVGTKAVADDLKLLVDTLGSSVTESLEKMEEASQIVFGKVEEMVSKGGEQHEEGKAEHQQTRDQLQEAVTLVEGLKTEVTDQNPKVLEAIQEVLALVGQHYEHSKTSTTDIQEKIVEAKPEMPLLPPPPEKYDDTAVLSKLDCLVESRYDDTELRQKLDVIAELKYDDTELREKLDQIIEAKYDDSELREKLNQIIEARYDDSELREMLDQLVEGRYDDTEVRGKLDQIIEGKYDDAELREKLDQLVEGKYDDTELRGKLDQLIEGKYDDSELREKLDNLVESKYDDAVVREKLDQLVEARYDDTVVHEKLDKLVTYSDSTQQAFTQLETLDKVHEAVARTAADIAAFLSIQTQRITDEHEDREKTLQDTIVSLERKRGEHDHLEASVRSLRDEEERLRNNVVTLRTEQESLIRQKTRLTGDVSSLETALQLRKEELFEVEARGERLERRIMESVMDQSRVLLMSKATKNSTDSMNRKRVKKPAAAAEGTPTAKPSPKPVLNMALSGKRNLAPAGQTGASRRIASLGQINSNVSSGGVKRSQSVRTPAGGVGGAKSYRKRSWGGDVVPAEADKENLGVKETVVEVDEGETPGLLSNPATESALSEEVATDDQSDAGTLRRSSYMTGSTDLYTGSEYDDTASEWTASVVGSSVAATDLGESEPGAGDMVVYGQ